MLKLTKIHINAQIAMFLLTGLQVYILYEMNGHLWELMSEGCIDVTMGIVFAPALAIAWIGKHFAGDRGVNDEE